MEEISMYWGAHLKGWHFFFSLFVFIGLPVATPAQPGKTQDPPQIVYLFSSSTCPHCRALKTSLDHLLVEQHNWQIKEFVLDQDPLAREELIRHKQRLNLPLSSVPITVIDNKYWVGFSPQIVERIGHIIKGDPKENHIDSAFEIPWIGRLNLEDNNIWINTILIAAVDGFNPCSLWVLTLLIGIVIGTKSRKKIAVIGVSFLLVTAFVYGLFIAGVVSVLNYLDFVPWVRTAIALFALFFGLVNVKDYFWYKQGIVLH